MDRPPHLRSVPREDVEEIDAPPAIQMGAVEPEAGLPERVAPVIGLGNMPSPAAANILNTLTPHVLATSVTAGTGVAVGWLASGELQGAAIGAGAQLTLLGLAGALFGGGRLPTWLRVTYGVVALGGAATAGYLVWQRR